VEIKIRQACYPVAAKNANGIIISIPFIVILPKQNIYSVDQHKNNYHNKTTKN
jgi:hypothetical protein